MKNTGMIHVNDISRDRLKAAVGNLHRMGAINTVVSSYDARSFPLVRYLCFLLVVLLNCV